MTSLETPVETTVQPDINSDDPAELPLGAADSPGVEPEPNSAADEALPPPSHEALSEDVVWNVIGLVLLVLWFPFSFLNMFMASQATRYVLDKINMEPQMVTWPFFGSMDLKALVFAGALTLLLTAAGALLHLPHKLIRRIAIAIMLIVACGEAWGAYHFNMGASEVVARSIFTGEAVQEAMAHGDFSAALLQALLALMCALAETLIAYTSFRGVVLPSLGYVITKWWPEQIATDEKNRVQTAKLKEIQEAELTEARRIKVEQDREEAEQKREQDRVEAIALGIANRRKGIEDRVLALHDATAKVRTDADLLRQRVSGPADAIAAAMRDGCMPETHLKHYERTLSQVRQSATYTAWKKVPPQRELSHHTSLVGVAQEEGLKIFVDDLDLRRSGIEKELVAPMGWIEVDESGFKRGLQVAESFSELPEGAVHQAFISLDHLVKLLTSDGDPLGAVLLVDQVAIRGLREQAGDLHVRARELIDTTVPGLLRDIKQYQAVTAEELTELIESVQSSDKQVRGIDFGQIETLIMAIGEGLDHSSKLLIGLHDVKACQKRVEMIQSDFQGEVETYRSVISRGYASAAREARRLKDDPWRQVVCWWKKVFQGHKVDLLETVITRGEQYGS